VNHNPAIDPLYETFAPARDALGFTWLDAAAFVAPALMCVEVRIVGRLFGSDIFLLAIFPLLLRSRWRLLTARLPMSVLRLELLWLAGQVATDLWRRTPFEDLARGESMIAFGLFHFAALYMLLYGSRQRIVEYALGLAVGGILAFFFDPSYYAAAYPWKFGVGEPITILVVVVAAATLSAGGVFASSATLLFAACVNLYMGFRSMAGVCFLASAFLMIQRESARLSRPSRAATVTIAVAAFAALAGTFKIYDFAASTGLLGFHAQQEFEVQSAGEFGVLLGGRGEIFSSALAIRDSPILGHGSRALDTDYALQGQMIMRDLGYKPLAPDPQAATGLIPEHSYLFGAWTNAGILGAVFWAWVFTVAIRAMFTLFRMAEPLSPLIAFSVVLLAWDLLFSPYGAQQRFFASYEVVLAVYILESARTGVMSARAFAHDR
jgi:hypothetical protein